ncbi:MAG: ABC transporter substrate-binding protein [Caldicoprobacterales bacterium]
MKRSILVFISLCLVAVLFLAGCGGKAPTSSENNKADTGQKTEDTTNNNEDTTADTGGGGGELSAPGEYPLVKDKANLKVLIGGNPAVEDFNTNDFTLWYEEKTNVHAEFEVLPTKDGDEKLNLILASGDYPDIIMSAGLSASQIMSYGAQGAFIPLNDMIEEHGFEIKKVFEDESMAYVKDLITFPDGNIYTIPDINQCYHCSMAQKLWIYKPWLDKLGYDVPKTLDEYKEILIAFKTQDPNGNGQADEIPLAAATDGWLSRLHPFFICSFIYADHDRNMFIKDGVIDISVNKPEYKEGLAYLRDLYAEGLISSEAFTQDGDQYRQMGENPDTVILGSGVGGHTGVFTQFYGESGRWLDYVIVPPLQGPEGTSPTCYYNPYMTGFDSVITDKCENPELAFKWLDGFYELETMMRSLFGRPDQEWRWAEEGEIGLNGEQALYKLLVPWSETVQNYCWVQSGPQARTDTFRLGEMANPDEPLEIILYEATKQYEPFRPDYTEVLPPLVFTEEQSNELADLEKTIQDYVEQMVARFITGDADLENDWDNYVSTLEDMGIDRYVEIIQEAYDTNFKQK